MSTPARKILIAGVGNIFLGDDAFGVEVVQRLLRQPQQEGVKVVDFGIRGFDLTYALMEGYDAAILVDVTARGGTPGTLYVIEPTLDEAKRDPLALSVETHGMNPAKVLALVEAMGGGVKTLRLVGCEPESFGDGGDDICVGLSAPVLEAVAPAVALVQELVAELRSAPHA